MESADPVPETIAATATTGSASTVLPKARATLDDDRDKAAAAACTKPMAAPEECMNSANSTTVHGRVLSTAPRTEAGPSTTDTEPLPTDCERVLDEKHGSGSAAKRETASDDQDESGLSQPTCTVSEKRKGSLLPVDCETENTVVAQAQSDIQPGKAVELKQASRSPTRTDDEPGQQDETGRGTKRDRSSYENRPDPASEKEPPLEQQQQPQQKFAAQSASSPKKKKTKTSLSSFAQDPQSTAKNPPPASHDSATQAMPQEQSTTLGVLQNGPEAAALRHWNEMVALIELLRAGSLEELPAHLHQSMLKTAIAQMNLKGDERRVLRDTAYYALFSQATKVNGHGNGQRDFKGRLRRALVASLFEEGDGTSEVRIRTIKQRERDHGYFKNGLALTSDTYHEFLRNYFPIYYPMKAESQATLEVLPRTSGPVETQPSVLGETTSFPNSHALNKDDSPSNEPNAEKEVLDLEKAQLARVNMKQPREIQSPKHQLATQHQAPKPPPKSISERSVSELLQQEFNQIDQEEDVRIRELLGSLTEKFEMDVLRIGKNVGAPVNRNYLLSKNIKQLSSRVPHPFADAMQNLLRIRNGIHFNRDTPTRSILKGALVRYFGERDSFEKSHSNGAPVQLSRGRSPGDQSSARLPRRLSSSFRAPAQSPERPLGGHSSSQSSSSFRAPAQSPERPLRGHSPRRSSSSVRAPAQSPERPLGGHPPGPTLQHRQDHDYYSGGPGQYLQRGHSPGPSLQHRQDHDYYSGGPAQYPQQRPSGQSPEQSRASFSGDYGRRDRQHQDDRQGVRHGANHHYRDENRRY